MQFPSNDPLIVSEPKMLPQVFPISHTEWIQQNIEKTQFHYHDCLELGLCVNGSGIEMINNHAFNFSNNTLSIIHENCLHDSQIPIKNDHRNRSLWRFIFADLRALNISEKQYGGFISSDPTMVILFNMMYQELENHAAGYQSIVIDLLHSLLTFADRQAPNDIKITAPFCPPEISLVINYITHSYHEQITVDSLARMCNMSTSTLCRAFMKYVGTSPMNFVNHTRLTIAQNMLESSNMSILDISESVGFRTLSSFNRLFLKQNGCSPSAIRKKGKAHEEMMKNQLLE